MEPGALRNISVGMYPLQAGTSAPCRCLASFFGDIQQRRESIAPIITIIVIEPVHATRIVTARHDKPQGDPHPWFVAAGFTRPALHCSAAQ